MRISVHFQMLHEPDACAITGVEGDITDLILPSVGDMVSHRDNEGKPCLGRVSDRMFTYDLPNGEEIDGTVTVMLSLVRAQVN